MTEPDKRHLTDATEIRALAHPVRIALLELLGREGPLTATQAGEQLGESPANTSFHLRTLAKYGFVEEAPGGTGRQRPWQRISQIHAFDLDIDDTQAAVAANALSNFFIDRNRDRRRAWNETYTSFPKPWRDASFAFDSLTYMTTAGARRGRRADHRPARAVLRPRRRPLQAAGGRVAGERRHDRPPAAAHRVRELTLRYGPRRGRRRRVAGASRRCRPWPHPGRRP